MVLFKRSAKQVTRVSKRDMPDGLWIKCESCLELIYHKDWEANYKACPKCLFHASLDSLERIAQLIDTDTFEEFDSNMTSLDPLQFKGPKTYLDKIQEDKKKTGLKSAIITGKGKIGGRDTVIGVTDSRFIMGSMGSVVGEKIARAIEKAIELRFPVIIVSGSGGGARMYEGCYSLMQMAKTSAALAKLDDQSLLFISVLTNPTMAGVMASFASLGDVIIAEPKALLGFTGPRVIKQTIQQELPEGFQTSEFLLAHGLIDMIVERKDLKSTLVGILGYTGKFSVA